MNFNANTVSSALLRKGFRLKNNRHKHYIFYLPDGRKTRIKTYMSHNRQDIGSHLVSQMSKQLHLTKEEFKNLVDCILTMNDYLAVLQSKNLIE